MTQKTKITKKAATTKKKAAKEGVAKKKTSPYITKDMTIQEVVFKHPELMEVFMEYGLHCMGCAVAQFDTIEAGARAHGVHPEYLLKDLNARLKKRKSL